MFLCKHLLGLIRELLDRVGIVIHRLLQDHVTLEHQHGALFVLGGITSFIRALGIGLPSPTRSCPHLGLFIRDHVEFLLPDPGLRLISIIEILLGQVGLAQSLPTLLHLNLEPGPRRLQLRQLVCDSLRLRSALGAGGDRHPSSSLDYFIHARLVTLYLSLKRLTDKMKILH